ncbi:MAG: iron chaperone [Anaerolineae bacterium]
MPARNTAKVKKQYASIDEYIADHPAEIQARLQQLRKVIQAAAPDAVEGISYNMPAFSLGGALVYYSAFKRHIGFYPAPRDVAEFKEELAHYQGSKGTLQFPHNQPLPLDLVTRIVRYRAREARRKEAARNATKDSSSPPVTWS